MESGGHTEIALAPASVYGKDRAMLPRRKATKMNLTQMTDVPGFVNWLAGIALSHHYVINGVTDDYSEEQKTTLTEQTLFWLEGKNYADVTTQEVWEYMRNDLDSYLFLLRRLR